MPLPDRLRRRARRLWRWLFPPEIELPPEVRRLLAVVYPTLDLDRVSFHRGLPHLLSLLASTAITLPATLSPRRTRIYVRPRYWDPASLRGLGLILHEAFHALQVQETGPGLGLVRPFTILYLAAAGGSGFLYRRHPMERDAYRVAGRSGSRFESTFGADRPALAAALGLAPCPEGTDVRGLCAPIETPSSGLRFWARLAASTPGGLLLLPLWLLLWGAVVIVLWLLRLLVETIGILAVALLWIFCALALPFQSAHRR